ncbi:MAG: TraR/DksA C4-type zinc finger protein [Phycisphaerae bacterium]|nr:TraR/DksA C4-type zinc finger protein [Phycisphaerae bacterium]
MVERKQKLTVPKTRATRGRRKKIEPEKPLSKEEIEYFSQKLLTIRQEILGDMGSMTGSALDHSGKSDNGELSNMPVHMADVGTDNYEQEFTLGLIEAERKVLREIDQALTKISEGTFGYCEATGEVINRARLEAKPYARFCIDYARKLEQGLIVPEEPEEKSA